MHFKTYDEIVDFAVGKEKEAANFYAECAQQEPCSGSKKTLMDMAAE